MLCLSSAARDSVQQRAKLNQPEPQIVCCQHMAINSPTKTLSRCFDLVFDQNNQVNNFADTAKHQASAPTQDTYLVCLLIRQQENQLCICLADFYFVKLSRKTASQSNTWATLFAQSLSFSLLYQCPPWHLPLRCYRKWQNSRLEQRESHVGQTWLLRCLEILVLPFFTTTRMRFSAKISLGKT